MLPDGYSITLVDPPPAPPPGAPAGRALFCYDITLPAGRFGGLCLDFPGRFMAEDPTVYGGMATDNLDLMWQVLDDPTRRALERSRRAMGLKGGVTYLCLALRRGSRPISGPLTVRFCFLTANAARRMGNVSLSVSGVVRQGSKATVVTSFLGFQQGIAVPIAAADDGSNTDDQLLEDSMLATLPVSLADPCTIQLENGDWRLPPLCPIDPNAVDLKTIFDDAVVDCSFSEILGSNLAGFRLLNDGQATSLAEALNISTVDEILGHPLIDQILALRSANIF